MTTLQDRRLVRRSRPVTPSDTLHTTINFHRWHDSTVGVWISEDWVADDLANMYRYVLNSPLALYDPFGLEKVPFGDVTFTTQAFKGRLQLQWKEGDRDKFSPFSGSQNIEKTQFDMMKDPKITGAFGVSVRGIFATDVNSNAPEDCYYWHQMRYAADIVYSRGKDGKLQEDISEISTWGPDASEAHARYPSQRWNKSNTELTMLDDPAQTVNLGMKTKEGVLQRSGKPIVTIVAEKDLQQVLNDVYSKDAKSVFVRKTVYKFQSFLVESSTDKPVGFYTWGYKLNYNLAPDRKNVQLSVDPLPVKWNKADSQESEW